MTSNQLRGIAGLAAITLVTFLTADALACGACGGATTAYYAPTAAYSQPAAYTTAYAPAYTSGWYPGYWLNRISQNIWGAPRTYAVAYPSTYYASYQPSYAVSYAAPTCSTCSSCTAAYAPCSSCAPTQAVTMRPACGCNDVVTQAVYQESSGCSSCGQATVVMPPSTATVIGPGSGQSVTPYNGTPTNGGPVPELAPSEPVPLERDTRKPSTGNDQDNTTPGPVDDTPEGASPASGGTPDPYESLLNGDDPNAGYFQPPALHDPKNNSAQRIQAPVWRAIYEKPAIHRQISARRITAEEAQRDAAGWTSASN